MSASTSGKTLTNESNEHTEHTGDTERSPPPPSPPPLTHSEWRAQYTHHWHLHNTTTTLTATHEAAKADLAAAQAQNEKAMQNIDRLLAEYVAQELRSIAACARIDRDLGELEDALGLQKRTLVGLAADDQQRVVRERLEAIKRTEVRVERRCWGPLRLTGSLLF
ncbi:hypothetical protein EJ05DRAFT_490571 [Pseudovirgaria hyperparasitica]|uniref:Uncharacterized protein n=1 Tax=Pseudovirgaria hyperparasitica TaxID=470096 RepID=A0A6A6VRU1_9PEZI|nr:uncharacterized protein EJ05DRAFT_490571 [Pseudovirgaria hyperparasitica]KAF2752875.1 hypothetical protein EJ05DRAFT_490571 [Pseudovirgaria hyperparasitica]